MKKDLQIKVKIKIANPVDLSNSEELELIVDTGAILSVIRKNRLEKLKINPMERRKFKSITGEVIERDIGILWYEINGKGKTISSVILGEESDTEVLGLHTIEGMLLTIDTTTGELKPIEEPLWLL